MKFDTITLNGQDVSVVSVNTAIVGTGAAGYNAADRLYDNGVTDICIITEGVNMGTSRNTGSDKQTYYKLTLSGDGADSVAAMAQNLFEGGAMDGDLALCEAALSSQCFYKLADAGVPFPHNRYGEFVGYKTDHDPRARATSAGPLTSKFMTEKLQARIAAKGIDVLDGYQVIRVLTDGEVCRGLLCLNKNDLSGARYLLINAVNVVYATGGPAGLYALSVYPESQSGASGLAFEAGAAGKNLTEWQYGIASTKFRWNLSGTYQQVLPRYISTDADGNDPREFMDDCFPDSTSLLDAIFLKGYQWPFDPRKIENCGSSLVDLLVHNEIHNNGRRVFLDFLHNPSCLKEDFSNLGGESYEYLKNSNALFGTPIERLEHMNAAAIKLYADHGIDLKSEMLEIAVCAQHNNGGLAGNCWWESNLPHLFPVGEVNGSHGVYRPGGSALNSGQVGSTRAAQFIAANYAGTPVSAEEFGAAVGAQAAERMAQTDAVFARRETPNTLAARKEIGTRMSKDAAFIRSAESVASVAAAAKADMESFFDTASIASDYELPIALGNYDLLVAQYVYASAMADYIADGGRSRGSYLVSAPEGKLPREGMSEMFRFVADDGTRAAKVQETCMKDGKAVCTWRAVRPIPQEDNWFENVWNAYLKGEIVK
ncbi:MAG: FAD-binding protein [Ruminococcaceae bacterium]|nr:FAD-binding protein [Oscillospiraceae bacterium]